MKKFLEHKIRQCEMWSRFFKDILANDCEELRKCVAEDLGYEDSENMDKHLLFSDDAKETYLKLNSGHSKTRNWLIVRNCSKQLGEKPLGTSHWSGLYNNFPAILLSWYGGAAIHYFDGIWKKKEFNSLADAYENMGIEK